MTPSGPGISPGAGAWGLSERHSGPCALSPTQPRDFPGEKRGLRGKRGRKGPATPCVPPPPHPASASRLSCDGPPRTRIGDDRERPTLPCAVQRQTGFGLPIALTDRGRTRGCGPWCGGAHPLRRGLSPGAFGVRFNIARSGRRWPPAVGSATRLPDASQRCGVVIDTPNAFAASPMLTNLSTLESRVSI